MSSPTLPSGSIIIQQPQKMQENNIPENGNKSEYQLLIGKSKSSPSLDLQLKNLPMSKNKLSEDYDHVIQMTNPNNNNNNNTTNPNNSGVKRTYIEIPTSGLAKTLSSSHISPEPSNPPIPSTPSFAPSPYVPLPGNTNVPQNFHGKFPATKLPTATSSPALGTHNLGGNNSNNNGSHYTNGAQLQSMQNTPISQPSHRATVSTHQVITHNNVGAPENEINNNGKNQKMVVSIPEVNPMKGGYALSAGLLATSKRGLATSGNTKVNLTVNSKGYVSNIEVSAPVDCDNQNPPPSNKLQALSQNRNVSQDSPYNVVQQLKVQSAAQESKK